MSDISISPDDLARMHYNKMRGEWKARKGLYVISWPSQKKVNFTYDERRGISDSSVIKLLEKNGLSANTPLIECLHLVDRLLAFAFGLELPPTNGNGSEDPINYLCAAVSIYFGYEVHLMQILRYKGLYEAWYRGNANKFWQILNYMHDHQICLGADTSE